jgi:hypothetical protein
LSSMNDNTRFIRRPRFKVAPPQIDQKMSECSRNLPPGAGGPLARPGRPGEQPNPGDAREAATTPGGDAEGCGANSPTAGQPEQKQKRLLGPGGRGAADHPGRSSP